MNRKGFTPVVIVTLLAGLIALGGIVYVALQRPAFQNSTETGNSNTASWKTYRNEKYGYAIKYPTSWSLEKNTDLVILRPLVGPESKLPTRDVIESPSFFISPISTNGQPISSIFNGKIERQIDLVRECSNQMIAERKSYICTPEISFAGERVVIIPYSKDVLLKITDDFADATSSQILSSLQLTSPSLLKTEQTDPASSTVDISNWKTYRNEKYGFEIDLPPDWNVETPLSGGGGKLGFISASTKRAIAENIKNCQGKNIFSSCIADGIPPADISFDNILTQELVSVSDIKTQTINGITFKVFPFEETPGETHYETTSGQNLYSFQTFTGNGSDFIKQIISTFRFIH